MKIPFLRLIFPLLLIAGPSLPGSGADSSPTPPPNEEKAVRGLVAAFGAAFANHDQHALALVFHEDGEFARVGEMMARGRAAIEEFHSLLLKGAGEGTIPTFRDAKLTLLDPQVRFLRPDVASVEVPWSMTGGVQNGRALGARQGLITFIATKEADDWGIAVMHTVDFPPAAPTNL